MEAKERKEGHLSIVGKSTCNSGQGLRNVAETCDLIKSGSSQHDAERYNTSVVPCMASYGDYVRGAYQTDLTSSLDMDILPPPTLTVFNLALISHKRVEYDDSIR